MFNIHQMRIGRPKKHLLGTQAASTTRRTAAVSPPTEARGAAGSSSWGPGCQLGTWKPTKRGIFMDFHGFSWIVMDFHGFSLIFMDFTMDFTVNFTHKPWLKVGLLSEDFPHVPQKTHTHTKKKRAKALVSTTKLCCRRWRIFHRRLQLHRREKPGCLSCWSAWMGEQPGSFNPKHTWFPEIVRWEDQLGAENRQVQTTFWNR